MNRRILVVEDEQHLASGLRFNLEAEGYDVDIVETGEDALQRDPADLVVLDVMLPGIDGFHVAAELRRRGQYMPILMLTARGTAGDILKGFEAGADDYLPKPFDLAILLARIKGLLRRANWQRPALPTPPSADIYDFDGKRIDFAQLQLETGGNRVPLTLMESNLLRYLTRHEGQVVSRKALLEDVWSVHEDTDTRAIDNFIVRLRKLIEPDPSRPKHLVTVRGVGYKFVR
jgi:DNA-binding response OmpR family regulator